MKNGTTIRCKKKNHVPTALPGLSTGSSSSSSSTSSTLFSQDDVTTGWSPQGVRPTGGGGLARVPNLRVCDHPFNDGGGTRRGRKGGLTSCRGTVLSAWLSTSSETGREHRAVRSKGKWSPRCTHLSLPNSQLFIGGSKGVRQVNRQGW